MTFCKSYPTLEKINKSSNTGNAWVFPKISHSTRKWNKTHQMERTWDTGTHNFPIVWVLFSHPILILWYTSSYVKWVSSPLISHSTRICKKNIMGRTWGTLGKPGRAVGSHTFPIVFVVFSYLIPILWYTSSLGKQMSFPSISHNIEKCSEMHQIGRPAKLVPILSPKYKYFFSIRFPS